MYIHICIYIYIYIYIYVYVPPRPRSFHNQNKRCASCGYPASKIRSYEWALKALLPLSNSDRWNRNPRPQPQKFSKLAFLI